MMGELGPVTDEMCAAALKAERAQCWNSDELRVWAMLAAAREAAPPPTPVATDAINEALAALEVDSDWPAEQLLAAIGDAVIALRPSTHRDQ